MLIHQRLRSHGNDITERAVGYECGCSRYENTVFSKIIPKEYLDHELEGHEWQGARELHIGGDLLVYRLSDKGNLITFVDIGSHSELFG